MSNEDINQDEYNEGYSWAEHGLDWADFAPKTLSAKCGFDDSETESLRRLDDLEMVMDALADRADSVKTALNALRQHSLVSDEVLGDLRHVAGLLAMMQVDKQDRAE